jgi:hypothetical protein
MQQGRSLSFAACLEYLHVSMDHRVKPGGDEVVGAVADEERCATQLSIFLEDACPRLSQAKVRRQDVIVRSSAHRA